MAKRSAFSTTGRRRKAVSLWITLGLIGLGCLFILYCAIARFTMPTIEMEGSVRKNDRFVVDCFTYGLSIPRRTKRFPSPLFRLPGLRSPEPNDMIVFIFPGERNQAVPNRLQYRLSRCVACAGDTIQIQDQQIYLNGQFQPPPAGTKFDPIPADTNDPLNIFPESSGYTRDNWGPMRIPKQGDRIVLNTLSYTRWRIFIMREGHRITMSGDQILIDDKPATMYTVERDYCFGMGDNRNNSNDSRYWGFIPMEDVIGQLWFTY